jgi:hypothetical protein
MNLKNLNYLNLQNYQNLLTYRSAVRSLKNQNCLMNP